MSKKVSERDGSPATQSKSKLLIIDSNCLCHIAKHAMDGLSYHEMQTGVIFGFLRQVLSAARLFKTDRFAFCWDSRKSYRKQIYPEYKAKRYLNLTPEEERLNTIAFSQFSVLRQEVLPRLGFQNIFIQTGFESDDLMASLVRGYDNSVIITTDNDLYQLLNGCVIYNPRTKKVLDRDWFYEKYMVEPDVWATVKSVAGCDTDNVKGINGIGVITAIKYLKGQLTVKSKALAEIKANPDIIKRNVGLVSLPMEGVNPLRIVEKEEFHSSFFMSVFQRYGFTSFLKEFDTWKRTFNMTD